MSLCAKGTEENKDSIFTSNTHTRRHPESPSASQRFLQLASRGEGPCACTSSGLLPRRLKRTRQGLAPSTRAEPAATRVRKSHQKNCTQGGLERSDKNVDAKIKKPTLRFHKGWAIDERV